MTAIEMFNALKVLVETSPDAEIYLQTDQEGNGYYPVRGLDVDCVYVDGEVYSRDDSAEDVCLADWLVILQEKPVCAVVFP